MVLRICVLGWIGAMLPALSAFAQEGSRPDREQLPRPVYRVGERLDNPAENLDNGPDQQAGAEHPLVPVIKMAKEALAAIRKDLSSNGPM